MDGATLLELEDEDLASSDFGVSVRVHRARILEEVAQLRTGCGVDQEGATVHKRKAQIEVDPSLEKASEEQLMLFDFEPVTRLWTEKTVMAKISKQPFSKGAMRAAYRMLDVAQHGMPLTLYLAVSIQADLLELSCECYTEVLLVIGA